MAAHPPKRPESRRPIRSLRDVGFRQNRFPKCGNLAGKSVGSVKRDTDRRSRVNSSRRLQPSADCVVGFQIEPERTGAESKAVSTNVK